MPIDEPLPDWLLEVAADASASPRWPDWTPRDNASLVLPRLDYESQLVAIKDVLRRNAIVDKQTDAAVEALYKDALEATGFQNERLTDAWIDTLHESTYQSAALSMSALGMLAPLYESLFGQAFYGIKKEFGGSLSIDSNLRRVPVDDKDFWEHQTYISSKGERKPDVNRGAEQLAKAIGLHKFIPSAFWGVFEALMAYRNKMFHNGFEWPENICDSFARRIQEKDWGTWFSMATTNEKPWMFYMTQPFIEECLKNVDDLLHAIGKFAESASEAAQL